MSERAAVIDIGSNSVRYMLCEHASLAVHPLLKTLETTRLALGQDAAGRLLPASMARTAEAVSKFVLRAESDGAPVYAYATSAVREASNRAEFLAMLPKGLSVAVLSGEQEGEMAYLGATNGHGTLLDIGGGSFQVVTETECFSAPIGCVRLFERIPFGSPKEIQTVLKPWADALLERAFFAPNPVVGVGGTITTLGALALGRTDYCGAALSGAVLTPAAVDALIEALDALGEGRKAHPLLKQRHNVILHGAAILRYLMDRFSIEKLIPSDCDGMEGFLSAVLMGKISVK